MTIPMPNTNTLFSDIGLRPRAQDNNIKHQLYDVLMVNSIDSINVIKVHLHYVQ